MKTHLSRLLITGIAAAVLGSTTSVFADFVPCPVQKAQWGVTTPLPDPWTSTLQEAGLKEQKGAFINGKEWLLCRYAFPGNDSLFVGDPGWTPPGFSPGQLRVSVMRPAFTNAKLSEVKCPAPQLKTQVLTNLPPPWTATTYVWKEVSKIMRDIASQKYIVCYYEPVREDVWGAGPSAILRSLEPDKGPPLAANPKPKPPLPGNLTSEFAVTGAKLHTAPLVETTCPAKVTFTGSVAANGKGQVQYRIVHNGAAGTPKQLDFGQAGNRPVSAEFQVGGITGPAVQAASPTGGGGSLAAPSAPNQHTGSARIQILKPQGGVLKSNDANYMVKCVAPKPDSLQGTKPTP